MLQLYCIDLFNYTCQEGNATMNIANVKHVIVRYLHTFVEIAYICLHTNPISRCFTETL